VWVWSIAFKPGGKPYPHSHGYVTAVSYLCGRLSVHEFTSYLKPTRKTVKP
jgi:hypothetical protein